MATRRNVFWDLSESNIALRTDGYIFYFSSEFKRQLYCKYYQTKVVDAVNRAICEYPGLKRLPYEALKSAFAYTHYRSTEKRGCRFEEIAGDIDGD